MPEIDTPAVAKTTLQFGGGDLLMCGCINTETDVHDTFAVFQSVPGAVGDGRGRELDKEAATGCKEGEAQTNPALVAFRFTSKQSLRQFALAALDLLQRAEADVPDEDQLFPRPAPPGSRRDAD